MGNDSDADVLDKARDVVLRRSEEFGPALEVICEFLSRAAAALRKEDDPLNPDGT